MGNVQNGPEEWVRSLPLITRFWFCGAFMTTIAGNLGMVKIYNLLFLWEPLKDNFEVWRLVTPFLYIGKFELATLFSLYFLVEYSKRYESSSGYNTGAGGGTADYAFALLFGIVVMLITYPFLTGYLMPLFGRNLTYFVLYIWTKRYPTVQVAIWGIPVPALWLPFALVGLSVLIGNPFYDQLHGIAIGHLYYFLVDVVPLVYGKDYLHTPQFLIDYFGHGAYVPPAPQRQPQQAPRGNVGGGGFAAPGRVGAPQEPTGLRRRNTGVTGGYDWGGPGHTLGGN